jgi:lipopolysaccharide/colanic/teichoic acid biosynthesis glycosyltransferase
MHPVGDDDSALDEAVRLVLRYLESWSVALDAAIIGRTLAAVLRAPAEDPRRAA